MSCGKNCKCKKNARIRFTELEATAHNVDFLNGEEKFAICNIAGNIFIELRICEVPGTEKLTALFPVDTEGEEFEVFVPDYIADLNEKLLASLDITPIIVDDPEIYEDDENEDEDEDDDPSEEEEGDEEHSAKLGAGLAGCRIGDMPTRLQKALARSLGFPETDEEGPSEEDEDDREASAISAVVEIMKKHNPEMQFGGAFRIKGGKLEDLTDKCTVPSDVPAECGDVEQLEELINALKEVLEEKRACKEKQPEEPVCKPTEKPRKWTEGELTALRDFGMFLKSGGKSSWDMFAQTIGRSAEACRKMYAKISK